MASIEDKAYGFFSQFADEVIIADFLFDGLVTIAIVDRRYDSISKGNGTRYCFDGELYELRFVKCWHGWKI